MARLTFVASLLLIVACSSAPVGASPSPVASHAVVQPTATPQATASPTVAATTAPTVTAVASVAPASCDPYYSNCEPRYTTRPQQSTAATPAGNELVVSASAAGKLVDPDGMSLYVFDNDAHGQPTCLSGCADNWPPLTVSADGTQQVVGGPGVSGTFTTVQRSDAAVQVIYNDRPLYHYVGDSAPGDTNGDGIGGIWHLATP